MAEGEEVCKKNGRYSQERREEAKEDSYTFLLYCCFAVLQTENMGL